LLLGFAPRRSPDCVALPGGLPRHGLDGAGLLGLCQLDAQPGRYAAHDDDGLAGEYRDFFGLETALDSLHERNLVGAVLAGAGHGHVDPALRLRLAVGQAVAAGPYRGHGEQVAIWQGLAAVQHDAFLLPAVPGDRDGVLPHPLRHVKGDDAVQAQHVGRLVVTAAAVGIGVAGVRQVETELGGPALLLDADVQAADRLAAALDHDVIVARLAEMVVERGEHGERTAVQRALTEHGPVEAGLSG